MERIPFRPEITFRLTVEKNDVPYYDIGVVVDPLVLARSQGDALSAVIQMLQRRVVADWNTQLKNRLEADKEHN